MNMHDRQLCRPSFRRMPESIGYFIAHAGRQLTLLLASLILAACSQNSYEHRLTEFNGIAMGTTWSVKVVDIPDTIDQATISSAIDTTLSRVNSSMSTYDADSELSKFNHNASTGWVSVSPAFAEVLDAATAVSDLTEGAFDVTVGPLVNLWGFGPEGSGRHIPDQQLIDQARARSGYKQIATRLEPPMVRKHLPNLYVDLSSIAKGYAVDQLATRLEELGVENYLVEVGGELRGRGQNARDTSWRIGIERPTATDRRVYAVVNLDGAGLATSGDYRNFFEENGRIYSHTIDPRTGYPVTHALASVTVVTSTAMQADALATALMVMGPEEGFALAEREGIAAFFIVKADDGFVDKASKAFAAYRTGGNGQS